MSTSQLGLPLPINGNESWGDDYRNALTTLDYLSCEGNTYYVDPSFTVPNLFPDGAPADRKHFDTIQGAITAAEGATPTKYTTIKIAPAQYDENLSITKDLALVGMSPVKGIGLVASGQYPTIMGATGSPTITFTPGASQKPNLTLSNLRLDNSHIGTGTKITSWPMLFKAVDQGDGNFNARMNIIFDHVYYMDSALTQDFEEAFFIEGWYVLHLLGCQFRFPNTDTQNGFTYPLKVFGHENVESKAALLRCKRSEFYHDGTGGKTIYIGNNSAIQSTYSSHLRASASDIAGENGAGTVLGDLANNTVAEAKLNLLGSECVWAYV